MKKLILIALAFALITTLKAQWVNDPVNNTFIANCNGDDGEIYTSTDPVSGNTYIQWNSFGANGWSPYLQRLTFDGTPQWGTNGIHISAPNFNSWSDGYAMAATTDDAVVSVFHTTEGQNRAVKINADGTFPWGEPGIILFNGLGGDRAEVVAGNDGGVWVLGSNSVSSYLQYIQADGTLGPVTAVSDILGGYNCMFGQLTLSYDNYVLFTYEKIGSAGYTDKQIYVMGVTPDGNVFNTGTLLMASQTFQSTYIHHAVPDGRGGGYAYIWHPGIGDAFNTYVFHFNESGISTISDPNGTSVHSLDPDNYYGNAYATADPITHDLIIAYEQTDAYTQNQSRVYVNRISADGKQIWGEGILVADYEGVTYADIMVDAFEDGSGFAVTYTKSGSNPYFTTIEAVGYDMDGNQLWATTMCSSLYRRTVCMNSTGFRHGQNIVAWINCINGSLYAQNITTEGTLGAIEPVYFCLPPEDFEGCYYYDEENDVHGARLTWRPLLDQPVHYHLYRIPVDNILNTQIIELEGNINSYFDESGLGTFKYQLKAVYEYGESNFALTPEGEDFVYIEITGLEENTDHTIINVTNVYNLRGQRIEINDITELPSGTYIIQGLTEDGRLVSNKKIILNN